MRLALLTAKEHDQLIDSIPDPVLVLDRARTIVDINLAALRLAGTPDDWRGMPAAALFPFLDTATLTRAAAASEVTIDAASQTYELRVSPMRTRRAGWLVILRDVTSERQLAAEREAFVTRSRNRVAAMSEELRTPASVIHGALQLVLGRATLSPDDHRVLSGALRSCERLADIVREILDTSTIEAERPPAGPRPFAVERLVIDALFDVAGRAEAKSVRIESAVSASLPLVVGDYDRLLEALVGILARAVDDAPGGSMVAIAARQEDAAIAVAIRHAGSGHAPDRIVRALVEQHGGRVALARVPNEGTSVAVYLPRAEAGSQVDGRPDTAVTGLTGPPRILVADDDADLREVVAEALEAQGFSVIAAADGREAIDVLGREPIDLAVLDLNMPHCTGDEVVRHVREGSRHPGLPVLMLTGSLDEREAAAHPGPDVILTKPTDLRRLVAEIRTLLGPAPD